MSIAFRRGRAAVRRILSCAALTLSAAAGCDADDGGRTDADPSEGGEAGAGGDAGQEGGEPGQGAGAAGAPPTTGGAGHQAGAGGAGDEEVTERGEHAGLLVDASALRAAFDREDPSEGSNPNLLLASPGSEAAEQLDDLSGGVARVQPVNLTLTPGMSTGRVSWSSYAGGLQSGLHIRTGYEGSNWPLPEGRENCVEPVVRVDCCTYQLTEGVDGSGDTTTYYSPADLWASDLSAQVALREVYAQIPIFLPYTDGDVRLTHGWIYNGADRNAHGSHDYSQPTEEGDDPAFRVRSVAAGTVVAKYWDAWHGNVLVIEHPGAGDFVYRSFYFHLRNGKTNDIAMAKSRTPDTGDEAGSRKKYLKFANLEDPSDLWWGTDQQAIRVDVGDSVRAHEHVAWSGNTGPGGAGKGLATDGTPSNTATANNHLHFMIAVKHPTWTGGDWAYVDPSGVYEQQSSGCYDLLQNTAYDRLLAPFYPYFHGVDLGVFNYYLYYYGQMGRSPSTFSVQHDGEDALAAGAFKAGLGSSWYVFDYMEAAPWQEQWEELGEASFRLTERSVTLAPSGAPRFNGVFRPDASGDWFTFGGQTLGDHQDSFEELTGQGYDLVDFFGYHQGNTDRVASIYAPGDGAFIHHGLLGSAEFKSLTNELAEDGMLPVDVNVMEMAGGVYLSALYRRTNDARMVHWGMSAAEYQQWMNFYLAQGWDLDVVQNYAQGSRFAAIWSD